VRSVFHKVASLRIKEIWKDKVLLGIYEFASFYFSFRGAEIVIKEEV